MASSTPCRLAGVSLRSLEASAKLKQEESEALLQQLLADQRASFEDQLAAVRAELAVEQARPQLAAVPAAAAPAPVPNRER